MASTIIDEFESRASYLPSQGDDAPLVVDPSTANDPPLDYDDLADMIHQMISDEFEANIEDGSIDAVSGDIIRLWRDILRPAADAQPSTIVEALERKAGDVKGKSVQATKGEGLQMVDGDSDSDWDDEADEDEEMQIDGAEAPQLVATERERQEPVVDDDGFTLVQSNKGKKSGR